MALHNENESAPFYASDRFTDADVAEWRAHPRFAEAVRQAAVMGLKQYRGNRLLNTLVSDRGRSAIGLLAAYLHQQRQPDDPRSGLTLSRLKAICADQNIGSPGRIEAVVVLMRLFGLLHQVRSADDRRVRQLVPTERLQAMMNDRWHAVFDAMALVSPEGKVYRDALADEAFERALVRRVAEDFLAGFRPMEDPNARELFGDRTAGLMIAFSLVTAGAPEEFPPRELVTVSISALARHFGVSRAHVRKLLRDAAAAGYISQPSGETSKVVVLPLLSTLVEKFFTNAFVVMRRCGREALEEAEATRQSVAPEQPLAV